VMALLRILGRKSAAIISPLSSLFAPICPYRPHADNPYTRGAARLVEVPISLSPWLRLPLIGTSFILARPFLRAILLRGADRCDLFNLEFHGIDFLGRDEVGEGLLRAGQLDARMALDAKMERIGALFDRLRGRSFLTLDALAQSLQTAIR